MFDADRDEVIARAADAGIERLLVPGYDVRSSIAAVELARRHPALIDAAVGVHPHYAAATVEAEWVDLEVLAREPGVVAVGEIGLDFHRNLSPPDAQRDALKRQLEMAATRELPVLVHDREAHREVTQALVEWGGLAGRAARGVLHCFSGDREMALELSGAGYLISFALPVTFSSARGPRAAATALPAGRLLTETDSPWLAAGRDRRNEPTTVVRVAAELARLRGTTIETVGAEIATAYAALTGR